MNKVATDIPENAMKIEDAFCPVLLTLVLKKQPIIPHLITAGKETVAVRIPNDPMSLALLEELDFPLAAPSANPFGCISPTSASIVFNYFKDDLQVVLDDVECQNGIESTIIGFENNQPVLYRHGLISIDDIEKIVGKVNVITNNDSAPSAPGMLSRHYAPKKTTFLTNKVCEFLKSFQHNIQDQENVFQEVLSKTGDLKEAAKNLYAAMHRLDKSNLDVIITERLPDIGLGKSINDRLERAIK